MKEYGKSSSLKKGAPRCYPKRPRNEGARGQFIENLEKNPSFGLRAQFQAPKTFERRMWTRGGHPRRAKIYHRAPCVPPRRVVGISQPGCATYPARLSGWLAPANQAAPRGKATCAALTVPGLPRAHACPIKRRYVTLPARQRRDAWSVDQVRGYSEPCSSTRISLLGSQIKSPKHKFMCF